MPRILRGIEEKPSFTEANLVDRLADEVINSHDSGQPTIYEQEFPTGMIRVVVIWDEWDRLSHEDRTNVILRAYDSALGQAYRERLLSRVA